MFWRILLFYVLAILIIGLLIPYTDPQLLRNEVGDIAVSPFTLVFQHAGLLSAATVMNAVILTSVLSAGNSGMYAATRMLFNMAVDGQAPAFFKRLTRGGVRCARCWPPPCWPACACSAWSTAPRRSTSGC